MRVTVIGNSRGGKSTLAAKLSAELELPLWEVDSILWREGWEMVAEPAYLAEHQKILDTERWVFDGLGMVSSFAPRIARSTHIVLVDLPLWQHHWLAAERQLAWEMGKLSRVPGGLANLPDRKAIHQGIHYLEREFMPEVRRLCEEAEIRANTPVYTISDADDLSSFMIEQ